MSASLDLPEDVRRRLEAEASRRGVPVDALVADLLDRELPVKPRSATSGALSFVGLGQARPDLSESYKDLRRDLVSAQSRRG